MAKTYASFKENERGKEVNLIKAQFVSDYDGKARGRHYTYDAGEHKVEVGDLVQLNERGQGVVTEINADEKEVESFKDRLKTIIGKVEEEAE